MDFGWIGSASQRYWMDWIDPCESNWIQLPERVSRYIAEVHRDSGSLTRRERVCLEFLVVVTA
jgi:hypothetical protein